MTTLISEEEMYQRIAKVKKTVVRHPAYKRASDEIEKVYRMNLNADITRHLLCTSDPGNGKTTLKNQLQTKYPPVQINDRVIQHLVCVETPSKPTIKSMAETILITLGDPMYYKGSAMQKTQRIRTLFKEKKVKMIIVDEFQHFVDHGGNRAAAEVSDWLKTLMEDTKVSFVLMGLPRSSQLLTINSQLKRRFSQKIKLPPFNISTKNQILIFGGIIKQTDSLFELANPIVLNSDLIRRFYFATCGIIDYTVKLLITAFELAVINKKQQLDMDILKAAFSEVIWDDCKDKMNPFDKKFTWQLLNEPGMPFYQAIEIDSVTIQRK